MDWLFSLHFRRVALACAERFEVKFSSAKNSIMGLRGPCSCAMVYYVPFQCRAQSVCSGSWLPTVEIGGFRIASAGRM